LLIADPVVDSGLQWLEYHNGDSAAEDRAIRPYIERPAMATRRDHGARFVPVSDAMRDADRRGAGQSHVALAAQNALARKVNRDQ
jgi:hypothetical protein